MKFVNELGNEIEIFGEYSQDLNSYTIFIVGPNSISENKLTIMEARNLRNFLCDIFEV